LTLYRNYPAIGARPGTLAIPPDSPAPKITVVPYTDAGVEFVDIEDPADLPKYLDGSGSVWIDVQGLGDEEVIRKIGAIFELGPIALEDAVNVPQRSKTHCYERFQLVICRMPILENGRITVPQVCLIIGKDWLLSFQERYFGFFEPVRDRLKAGRGRIRESGPDYLAYALIDTLADRYYPLVEALSRQLDEIELEITENPQAEVMGEIQAVRRQLVVLRRVGRPQGETIGAMIRESTPFVSDEVTVFLRDTDGHFNQILELVDSSREMSMGLSEIYLANVSQRTNEVMKVLTLMASLFIPLTFIAGIYGMNFEYIPELQHRSGYFVAIGVMVVIAVVMLVSFYRHGWIGGPKKRTRRPSS